MHRASLKSAAPPAIHESLNHVLSLLRAGKAEQALTRLLAYPDQTRGHPLTCYLAALISVNAGRDDDALSFYDSAIALDPGYADALEGRARLLHRLKRLHHAIADYRALLRIRPGVAETHYNLGAAYEDAGRRAEALGCYERALDIAPTHSHALAAKALLLYDCSRVDDALQMLGAALAADPSNETAWYNRGAILASLGDHAEAVPCFEAALKLAPSYGKARYGAAVALHKLNRQEEALAACEALLAQAPGHFEALFLRGNIRHEMRRFAEALADFDAALAKNRNHLGVLCNRGAVLRELGRIAEAAAMFEAALALDPACLEALLGRGIVEFKNARIEESLEFFERALKADPASATAFCGRGLALQYLGRIEEARRDFERALKLNPDLPDARAALSALQLLVGEFEEGFAANEYRLTVPGYCLHPRRLPLWKGEDIAGKKLLVVNEAAHGDAIMLARYFPLLHERGIDATVECLPHMAALLSCVPGVRFVTKIDPAETFDYQLHLFSLPYAFKTREDTVPACTPYLFAESDRLQKWAARVGEHGFKIGIAWQGNPDPKIDIARAAPLAAFAPLAAIPGCRLISLQKGHGVDQIAGASFPVETLGGDFDAGPDAFLDAAAVMGHLDLIVAVDTSIAHLAGALARPVWVALKHVPEWRWMLGRRDSPWYPTMRLFRQQAQGDWGSVFADMAEALPALMAEKARTQKGPLLIPAGVGELIDKLTILEIKSERIGDPFKLANVRRECALLSDLKRSRGLSEARLENLAAELKQTNLALWEIEDAIRAFERRGEFGSEFLALARRVYRENDKRAALKRRINDLSGSAIVEEKHYGAT